MEKNNLIESPSTSKMENAQGEFIVSPTNLKDAQGKVTESSDNLENAHEKVCGSPISLENIKEKVTGILIDLENGQENATESFKSLENAEKVAESPRRSLNVPLPTSDPYMNFIQDFRVKYKGEQVTNTVMAALAAAKWRTLSEQEKQPYIDIKKNTGKKEKRIELLRRYISSLG
uniref:HMG box domain-containing protein n=1 Tax=Graphocephala atropunctata TaxID=36148 RepID=A0A1B6KLF2_9HEMI